MTKTTETYPGDPNEYGYPRLRWHHYWGIMDGQWRILTRAPDERHPANGRWEMWKDENRPLGVEPSTEARYDFTNA